MIPIENDVQPYAWGMPGGVSRALGWPDTTDTQAELWLGAHPSSPSRPVSPEAFTALDTWETQSGTTLPYLLKVLTASKPLSLQAHPNPAQAAAGFAREEAAGIDRAAFNRNYKDPYAKPELIVALDDGFQALCGFRPIDQTAERLTRLAAVAEAPEPILAFRDLLVTRGLREAVAFTLSGHENVAALVAALVSADVADPTIAPVISVVQLAFPNDNGLPFALLLNHVTLQAGESLWLPAGNVHAYLQGSGMELMGPSDNVLRGGLTPKHVDTVELMNTLVFEESVDPRLAPIDLAAGVRAYRPSTVASGEGVPFELWEVTADAQITVPSAAIFVVTDGDFTITLDGSDHLLARGTTHFLSDAADVAVTGSGRLWVATAR
nr:mannose-6-phosphate isomerase, class I [Microbacterium sp. NC79]